MDIGPVLEFLVDNSTAIVVIGIAVLLIDAALSVWKWMREGL